MMKALAWMGNQGVAPIETPAPGTTESDDAIIAVTGIAICGIDLNLYHGEFARMQKGDILGHEVAIF